jgi:hypothetical protein
MAKFLNKKEQVIDFELSPYGKYLLSIGRFKPVYYSFLDSNILYDSAYAGFSQSQNETRPRIKNNTAYLESVSNLGDPATRVSVIQSDSGEHWYDHNITPAMKTAGENIRQNVNVIGDAALEGAKNAYPSWKVVMLQGQMSGSQDNDPRNSIEIPQIHITASYTKKVVPLELNIDPKNVRDIADSVGTFSDNTQIKLIMNDPVLYLEEINTMLFTENFDIEVYEVIRGSSTSAISGGIQDTFERKYFDSQEPQVVDGIMVKEKASFRSNPGAPVLFGEDTIINTSSVGYYFDFALDHEVNKELACKGASTFNRSSYYVDLDFNCTVDDEETIVYADIYGEMTEPEICL